MTSKEMDDLRDRWNHLYKEHLPQLAKARDPVQTKWPVYLDHCFARIVLDNAVGNGKPWMQEVKQPAVKNMTKTQLEDAIELAEQIATGQADLAELNQQSLELRGKKRGRETSDDGGSAKKRKTQQKQKDATVSSYFLPSPPRDDKTPANDTKKPLPEDTKPDVQEPKIKHEDMTAEIKRINSSTLTPFRKQTLKLLCHIPRGRYSTYQAMSDYITKTSHKTCARAVGNAMRNNPFAPEVPCHRILAADGSLGGFGGFWGEDGKFANKKHELLFEEGVRFDSRGKVKGPPFREFGG